MMEKPHRYNISDLQEDIRRIAHLFGQKEIAPITEELDRRSPEFPRELYRSMAEAGFLGYTSSIELGGKGKSWIEYTTLIEELSYFDASVGFILSIANMSMISIELFGNLAQKQKFIPGMINGDIIGAFALTEPGAGSDATNLKTQAVLNGRDYIIEGEKRFISTGDVADIVILIGIIPRDGGQHPLAAFIVETKNLEGFHRRIFKHKMGLRGSTTAELIFNGSRISAENLLGEVGQGFKIAMKSLDYSRVAIAAQAVGLAQACLDRSIDFALQRKAFGAPIAKLATIQDMIAEMSSRLEAARMLTYKAALLMDEKRPFSLESAQAKLIAAETVNFVADRAVQIHGGYGYVGDFSDIEKLYRDARVIPIYEGTSEIQKMIIARHILR